jgi:hypothetical protein
VIVRVAGAGDAGAIASLRALWHGGQDPDFGRRMAEWLGADERRYARLVLSPSAQALPFYRRAGFIVPDDGAGDDRLLVRRTSR